MTTEKVTLEQGKYEITMNTNGAMRFYRHGEPWQAGQDSFGHAKLVSSMAYRILELEAFMRQLAETDGGEDNVRNAEVLAARVRSVARQALLGAA